MSRPTKAERARHELVARYQSEHTPGKTPYEVRIDPDTYDLSCDCPRWCINVHFAACPEKHGGKCNCPRGSFPLKVDRTCRHVRDAHERIDALGGPALAIRFLQISLNIAPPRIAVPQMVRPNREVRRPRGQTAGGGPSNLRRPRCTNGDCKNPPMELQAADGTTVTIAYCAVHIPGAQPTVAAPRPVQGVPEWLGGGRAIIVRD